MNSLQRREFLKLAAMGVTATAIAGQAGRALGDPGMGQNPVDVDAVEGTLLNLREGSLELRLEEGVRTFAWNGSSAAWRAGDVAMTELQLGESVLVRFNADGLIEHAWSNLTRFLGQVTQKVRGGYRIQAHHGAFRDAEVEILADGRTLVEHPLSGRRAGVELPVGAIVDVIGFSSPRSFVATLIYHVVPVPDALVAPTQDLLFDRADAEGILTASYSGYATWFDCGNRAGACGSCNTSNSAQCAWPSIGTGCRFSGSCKNQVVLSCGSNVNFKDTCSGKTKTLKVADCGPNENVLCARTCTRCGTVRTPFIDLTKPTFAVFDNPAVYGCLSASVTV